VGVGHAARDPARNNVEIIADCSCNAMTCDWREGELGADVPFSQHRLSVISIAIVVDGGWSAG
jgi:hypothetical protein